VKRVALIATLIGAASISAVAFGATTTTTRYYTGRDHDKSCETGAYDCRVYFDGVVKNGRVTTVKYLELSGIPVKCDEGRLVVGIGGVYAIEAPIHVNRKRKFSGQFTTSLDTSPKATFWYSGTFSKGYKGVAGNLKVYVRDLGSYNHCGSKVDEFNAHKAPNPPPFHP
jgi:hypothetical protein